MANCYDVRIVALGTPSCSSYHKECIRHTRLYFGHQLSICTRQWKSPFKPRTPATHFAAKFLGTAMFNEKGLTFRPLVLLLTANIKIKCVCSICGVTKGNKTEAFKERSVPVSLFDHRSHMY